MFSAATLNISLIILFALARRPGAARRARPRARGAPARGARRLSSLRCQVSPAHGLSQLHTEPRETRERRGEGGFTRLKLITENSLPLCGACPIVGYCVVFSINYLRKKLQLCGVCVVYVCFYIYEDVRTLGAAFAVSTLPHVQ